MRLAPILLLAAACTVEPLKPEPEPEIDCEPPAPVEIRLPSGCWEDDRCPPEEDPPFAQCSRHYMCNAPDDVTVRCVRAVDCACFETWASGCPEDEEFEMPAHCAP